VAWTPSAIILAAFRQYNRARPTQNYGFGAGPPLAFSTLSPDDGRLAPTARSRAFIRAGRAISGTGVEASSFANARRRPFAAPVITESQDLRFLKRR